MLEEFSTREVLPVRVFDPLRDDVFVREILHVFEDAERYDQPRRQRRSPDLPKLPRVLGLKPGPVDPFTELHQRVSRVDQSIQSDQKHLFLRAFLTPLLPTHFAAYPRVTPRFLANKRSDPDRSRNQIQPPPPLFRGDYLGTPLVLPGGSLWSYVGARIALALPV